ncbi:hypothetical protein, partial [Rhizobium leguminosarum]|uniref:hypothetical protein n=1 Tax=Rhizobium leguminosarum TaxID=384 RepID=UPI003F99B797
MFKRFSYFILFFILLTGCEKSISFTPDNADPLVVVEATIENDLAPIVILSHSVNYFSEITPDILANSFIHDAEIEI